MWPTDSDFRRSAEMFLAMRARSQLDPANALSTLPAAKLDIERELLDWHVEELNEKKRNEISTALCDLATFVDDDDARLLNVYLAAAARNETQPFAATRDRLGNLINGIAEQQRRYLISSNAPDSTPPFERHMERTLATQHDAIKQSYGGTATVLWLVAMVWELFHGGLGHGFAFIAFAIVGAFLSAAVIGGAFYVLHKFVVRRLVASQASPRRAMTLAWGNMLAQTLATPAAALLLYQLLFG